MPTPSSEPPRQFWPSMGALSAGLLTTVVLSGTTDYLLGLPSMAAPFYLLALSYRSVYAVLGAYLTARLAPRRPMRHAVEIGIVGCVISLGALAWTWSSSEQGPLWYPLAVSLGCIPCGWLGGILHRSLHEGS